MKSPLFPITLAFGAFDGSLFCIKYGEGKYDPGVAWRGAAPIISGKACGRPGVKAPNDALGRNDESAGFDDGKSNVGRVGVIGFIRSCESPPGN